jgi:hypothetical protein
MLIYITWSNLCLLHNMIHTYQNQMENRLEMWLLQKVAAANITKNAFASKQRIQSSQIVYPFPKEKFSSRINISPIGKFGTHSIAFTHFSKKRIFGLGACRANFVSAHLCLLWYTIYIFCFITSKTYGISNTLIFFTRSQLRFHLVEPFFLRKRSHASVRTNKSTHENGEMLLAHLVFS